MLYFSPWSHIFYSEIMLVPIRWWALFHSTCCLATILASLQLFKALAFTVTSALDLSGIMSPVNVQVESSFVAIQLVAIPGRKVTGLACGGWFGFWRGWSSVSSASTLTHSTALKKIIPSIEISTGSLWNGILTVESIPQDPILTFMYPFSPQFLPHEFFTSQ